MLAELQPLVNGGFTYITQKQLLMQAVIGATASTYLAFTSGLWTFNIQLSSTSCQVKRKYKL